ncbi:MAG TPA: DoxX family protein [Terriglobales bacterium]|nr:DoxX family protein [Terriglobales bacterium]
MNLKERTYLWYIVLLRLYIGYYLLVQGIRKFQRNFPHGDWVTSQIGDLSNADLYTWYRNFLLAYVVPHAELFGYLVTAGEILVGTCLLLGFFTRLSALLGLFMVINYFLGPGMAHGGLLLAYQKLFILCLAVIFFTNPGRTIGLDGVFFSGRGLR